MYSTVAAVEIHSLRVRIKWEHFVSIKAYTRTLVRSVSISSIYHLYYAYIQPFRCGLFSLNFRSNRIKFPSHLLKAWRRSQLFCFIFILGNVYPQDALSNDTWLSVSVKCEYDSQPTSCLCFNLGFWFRIFGISKINGKYKKKSFPNVWKCLLN